MKPWGSVRKQPLSQVLEGAVDAVHIRHRLISPSTRYGVITALFLLIRPVRGVLMYALPYSLLGALRMGVHLNPPPQR